MTTPSEHACPGCGVRIPNRIIVCKACWRALPPEVRWQARTALSGTARARILYGHFVDKRRARTAEALKDHLLRETSRWG